MRSFRPNSLNQIDKEIILPITDDVPQLTIKEELLGKTNIDCQHYETHSV
jgi:hypothetical protein